MEGRLPDGEDHVHLPANLDEPLVLQDALDAVISRFWVVAVVMETQFLSISDRTGEGMPLDPESALSFSIPLFGITASRKNLPNLPPWPDTS